jgi:tetratricopeptide (TPR) repeat protein
MESLQKQLVSATLNIYSNAIAKKVDIDNFLDIHLPDVHEKKGTHLFFNTSGGSIKFGFYCRDNDFVENAINSSNQIEKYSQGLRLLNNPHFESVEDAVKNAKLFIDILTNKGLNKLDSANDYFNIGKDKYFKNEVQAAIEDFNQAILLDVNLLEPYYFRGLSYISLKNNNDAIEDFNRVIELDSDYKWAYFHRGNVW